MTSPYKSWLRLAALIPSTALSFLDQTILPVALPTIQKSLHASSTQLQWSVNAYILAIAVFVLVSGKISDRIGHRNALNLGMIGFAFFSALCGFSRDIDMLIVFRAFQGMSAAFMFPAQNAIIAQIFQPDSRGKATGVIVSIGSIFLILGPLIGGYLTEVAGWDWIFWVNLPTAAIGLFLIRVLLPPSKLGKGQIDLLGFLYFTLTLTSLIVLLMQAPVWGWSSAKSLLCLSLFPAAAFLLMKREGQTPHSFLELALFKRPVFTAINISVFIANFVQMITVFWAIYFQQILEYTPLQTGLITFASSCPVFFMAPLAGYLSDRFSLKVPVSIGFFCLICSFSWLSFHSIPPLHGLMGALIVFGMGIPLVLTPSFSSALASIPVSKMGIGIGMLLTFRMLGGAVGLALIHLFAETYQTKEAPLQGLRLATIGSFSHVHLILAGMLIIALALTFVLHTRKSDQTLSS